MPHVKGNKFKPKPTEPPSALDAGALPQAVVKAGDKRKGKKQPRHEARASAAGSDVAVEEATPCAASAAPGAPGAHNVAKGTQPASKKRRCSGNHLQLPSIPTVVAPAPKPGAATAAAATNWAALKAAMDATKQQQQGQRPRWQGQRQRQGGEGPGAAAGAPQPAARVNRPGSTTPSDRTFTTPTKVVALDCEMVGVGPDGERSALARVCVVNSAGNVLLDRFVRPKEKVTDFRTKVSGVRPSNLRDAAPFDAVQREVAVLLKGRIVVGHAIENDLEALLLSHKRKDVRDTAKYPPLMKVQARTGKLKSRALRHLASEVLGLSIQEGEHSPVDDARAALYLYLKHRKEWERWLAAGGKQQQHPAVAKMLAETAARTGMFVTHAGKKETVALSLTELAARDIMSDL